MAIEIFVGHGVVDLYANMLHCLQCLKKPLTLSPPGSHKCAMANRYGALSTKLLHLVRFGISCDSSHLIKLTEYSFI